jgi:hypothetical protein
MNDRRRVSERTEKGKPGKQLRFIIGSLFMVVLSVLGLNVDAYDFITHAQMSQTAYDRSQRVRQYLDGLGIKDTDQFGSDAEWKETDFTGFFSLRGFFNLGTLRDWVAAGAIREDDYSPLPIALQLLGCEPPYNPLPKSRRNRPLNHFFDVQHRGAALNPLPPFINEPNFPARDWALNRQSQNDLPGPSTSSGNFVGGEQFSIGHARDYQWNSLTKPSEVDRKEYTALFFRALGQVIHTLQDMAQPQHTRNDPHPTCLGGTSRSVYEKYVEDRATGQPIAVGPPQPLDFGNYDLPVRDTNDPEKSKFAGYQDFWTTGQQTGLADFSSLNFFSHGTNLPTDCAGFSQPSCSPNSYMEGETVFSVPTIDGESVSGPVTLLLGTVQDRLTGVPTPMVRLTSRSLWDALKTPGSPEYTLNKLNYDAMVNLLVPRAVGYSARFLDYFFRGEMQVFAVTGGIRITNPKRTDPAQFPTETMVGDFIVYYDDAAGNRTQIGLAVNVTLAPGDTSDVIPVEYPPDNTVMCPGHFIVVFRGKLGAENDAVVASATAQYIYYVSTHNGIQKLSRVDAGGCSAPTTVWDNTGPNRIGDSQLFDLAFPAVSPDGSQIAFQITSDPTATTIPLIYVFNIRTGGQPTFLTTGSEPSWSPDGSQIAFRRTSPICQPDATDQGIFVRNVAPSAEHQIIVSVCSFDAGVVWSPPPTSNQIAISFLLSPGDPQQLCGPWFYFISIFTANGTVIGPVSCSRDDSGLNFLSDGFPAWSPDARKIVFTRYYLNGPVGHKGRTYVVDVAAKAVRNLTGTDGRTFEEVTPAWSPDGRVIAISSDRGGKFDIWLVDAVNGTYLRNLTQLDPAETNAYPVFDRRGGP